MASGVKFIPNTAGYRAIMCSSGMQATLSSEANTIRARADSMANAKYGVKVTVGAVRARGIVYTSDRHAMYSNAKHNTLLKALG